MYWVGGGVGTEVGGAKGRREVRRRSGEIPNLRIKKPQLSLLNQEAFLAVLNAQTDQPLKTRNNWVRFKKISFVLKLGSL